MVFWKRTKSALLVIAFLLLGAAEYALLYRRVRDLNPFVPRGAYADWFLASFAAYVLLAGLLYLLLLIRLRPLYFRVALTIAFYVLFYFLFLRLNAANIDGFAP